MKRAAEAFAERLAVNRLQSMTGYERIVFYELIGLPHARVSGDQRQLAWGLSDLGLAYAGERRFAEAAEYIAEAEALFTAAGDVEGLATTALHLGVAYAESRQLDAAERAYRRAFDMALACDHAKVAQLAAQSLVNLYRDGRVDSDPAGSMLARLSEHARDHNLPFLAVRVAQARAERAERAGRSAESLAALTEALALACAADDPQWVEIADRIPLTELVAGPAAAAYEERLRAAAEQHKKLGYRDEADGFRRRIREVKQRRKADRAQ
jgi:tetratricopeptide (TPR) repeat protein